MVRVPGPESTAAAGKLGSQAGEAGQTRCVSWRLWSKPHSEPADDVQGPSRHEGPSPTAGHQGVKRTPSEADGLCPKLSVVGPVTPGVARVLQVDGDPGGHKK